ncbi:MAG: enoyl-CoA hydratase, partial [Streptomycetaceae bacterium]|nr:enoyl-CoA hydratase [Streptomycetaceae bacterium]
SDLLVIEDKAKIGYPPTRVWGTPTTALWAHQKHHPERGDGLQLDAATHKQPRREA